MNIAINCRWKIAFLVSQYANVIFADASHEVLENGFEVKSCTPANHYFFSSHIQSPETILYLVDDLYNKQPAAYTMAISGLYWELKTSLSKEAKKNLQSAITFFHGIVFYQRFNRVLKLKKSQLHDQLPTSPPCPFNRNA